MPDAPADRFDRREMALEGPEGTLIMREQAAERTDVIRAPRRAAGLVWGQMWLHRPQTKRPSPGASFVFRELVELGGFEPPTF
jgi:hypothetical protein